MPDPKPHARGIDDLVLAASLRCLHEAAGTRFPAAMQRRGEAPSPTGGDPHICAVSLRGHGRSDDAGTRRTIQVPCPT